MEAAPYTEAISLTTSQSSPFLALDLLISICLAKLILFSEVTLFRNSEPGHYFVFRNSHHFCFMVEM